MTTKKKPGIQKQLTEARNAPAALAAAEAALAAKQKEIDLTKSEILNYERSMREAQSEAKQIHAFLDAVPNPPASKALDGYTTINAMTRLSVWLATRGQGKG
jgi:multidrug resistance efflux pump